MKPLLLATGAVLLGAATNVVAAPTRVYIADNVNAPFDSAVISKNDLAATGDKALKAMLVKRADDISTHVDSAMWSRSAPTTAEILISRLLPANLKFPSDISSEDWTAIQVTLLVFDEMVIKSQSDLHQACTGAKVPLAYGFKPEIFCKLCTPEITMPVSSSEVAKAQEKVDSCIFIDNKLLKYNNDFSSACTEAKGADAISSGLDRSWILSQLCKVGP